MSYPRPDFCPKCGHHYAKLFVDGSILCSGCGDDRRSAQRRKQGRREGDQHRKPPENRRERCPDCPYHVSITGAGVASCRSSDLVRCCRFHEAMRRLGEWARR